MSYIIYKLTIISTDEYYYGKHDTAKVTCESMGRWYTHASQCKHNSDKKANALEAAGITKDNFKQLTTFVELETGLAETEAMYQEAHWVNPCVDERRPGNLNTSRIETEFDTSTVEGDAGYKKKYRAKHKTHQCKLCMSNMMCEGNWNTHCKTLKHRTNVANEYADLVCVCV